MYLHIEPNGKAVLFPYIFIFRIGGPYMNQVGLVGRIARDIEPKLVGEQQVINNSLAVNRTHRDKTGEYATDFISFVAWGSHAKLLQTYCQKGQRIAIEGRLQTRSYQSHDQTRYTTEVLVTNITLLDRLSTSKEPLVQFPLEEDELSS